MVDKELLKNQNFNNDRSGATATSVLISQDKGFLICANAGDTRAVLSTDGTAKPLSFDHKPTLPVESERIIAAGGFVDMGRVNGNLALSRAIGDFEYKSNKDLLPQEQQVTCSPDLIRHDINYQNDEFVIVACDGIWDCLSSQDCVELIHYGINQGTMTLTDIASRIIDVCCSPTTEGSGIGCDNMSIIIVALLQQNESLHRWFERIAHKKHSTPISFEQKRREIYQDYEFPVDDRLVFETTFPREESADDKIKKVALYSEEIPEEPSKNEEESNEPPLNLLSLDSLLKMGNKMNETPNTETLFHGHPLAEMIHSLSDASAGETCPDTDYCDEENVTNNNEDNDADNDASI